MDINELALYKWFQGYAYGIYTGDQPDDYFCHLSVEHDYEIGGHVNVWEDFSAIWMGDEERDNYLFNGEIATFPIY